MSEPKVGYRDPGEPFFVVKGEGAEGTEVFAIPEEVEAMTTKFGLKKEDLPDKSSPLWVDLEGQPPENG